jgi:hypothetical protein
MGLMPLSTIFQLYRGDQFYSKDSLVQRLYGSWIYICLCIRSPSPLVIYELYVIQSNVIKFVNKYGFNATFNNISVISWRSVLLVEETGVPGENHRPVVASRRQNLSHNILHLALFEIRTHNISGDRH